MNQESRRVESLHVVFFPLQVSFITAVASRLSVVILVKVCNGPSLFQDPSYRSVPWLNIFRRNRRPSISLPDRLGYSTLSICAVRLHFVIRTRGEVDGIEGSRGIREIEGFGRVLSGCVVLPRLFIFRLFATARTSKADSFNAIPHRHDAVT